MKRLSALPPLVILAMIFVAGASAGEVLKWTDEDGATHFADSLASVPPRYRDQVEQKRYRKRTRSTVRQQSGQEERSYDASPQRRRGRGALAKFEVPYRAYEGAARRIIIPVTFNNSVTANMVLDTGAPGMLIRPRLAEKLGIFEKDDGMLLTRSGGLGGSVPAIYTIIDRVNIGGAEDRFIPTTIAPFFGGPYEGLIGMDFMAGYSIRIDTRRHVVVFEEQPPTANMPGGHDATWWRINFHKFSKMREQWKTYSTYWDKRMSSTGFSGEGGYTKEMKAFAQRQYAEANKLFGKLDSYASRNAVPMHWRKY